MSNLSAAPAKHGSIWRACFRMRNETALLILLAVVAVVSEILYLALIRLNAIDGFRPVSAFVAIMLALFALCGCGFLVLRQIQRRTVAGIILVAMSAIVFRITLIPAGLAHDASLSELMESARADIRGERVTFDRYLLYDDDIWRYLWDGHVGASSINPFLYAPADRRLNPLAQVPSGLNDANYFWQDIRDNINHSNVPSIYPPLAQFVFRASHAIAPGSVIVLKSIVVLVDLFTMLFVWLGLRRIQAPLCWFLLYAWNPLLIKTVAGSGHVDILVAAMLALFTYLILSRAKLGAAIALAGAITAKLGPLILLPLAAKRIGWRNTTIAALLVVAAYLPFLDGGVSIFSGLSTFARNWQFNSAFFVLTSAVVHPFTHNPGRAARMFGMIAAIATYVWVWRRDNGEPDSFASGASNLLAAEILFSPTVMPWYLVWLLPVAVLGRVRTWIWFTAFVCASFFVMVEGKQWTITLVVEYGSLLAASLTTCLRRQGMLPLRWLTAKVGIAETNTQTTLRSEPYEGETV